VQVGLLLTLSGLAGTLLEPVFALLSDAGRRRRIVIGGGVVFVVSLFTFAAAPGFTMLLGASIVFSPASGAFVSLAQATWMDLEPSATERNMARWVLAGSAGNVVGPILLGTAILLGSGWREATVLGAVLAVPVLLAAARIRFPDAHPELGDLRAAARGAIAALRRRSVLRWLTLLQLTDLLGDVFLGFLALYLVDVAGASPALAGAGVATFVTAGLAGDAVLIPLLGRFDGSRLLRWSAFGAIVAYPAFLGASSVTAKVVLLIPLGIMGAGWYAIPQGRLFAELPARGGTAVAIGAPADLVGSLLPLAIGAVAARAGLDTAMWLLLGAPLALLLLLPRRAGPGS
jgi:FSR family fosmidomycin resistance protein-like MFS transporter